MPLIVTNGSFLSHRSSCTFGTPSEAQRSRSAPRRRTQGCREHTPSGERPVGRWGRQASGRARGGPSSTARRNLVYFEPLPENVPDRTAGFFSLSTDGAAPSSTAPSVSCTSRPRGSLVNDRSPTCRRPASDPSPDGEYLLRDGVCTSFVRYITETRTFLPAWDCALSPVRCRPYRPARHRRRRRPCRRLPNRPSRLLWAAPTTMPSSPPNRPISRSPGRGSRGTVHMTLWICAARTVRGIDPTTCALTAWPALRHAGW